jgi:hypothetical protein
MVDFVGLHLTKGQQIAVTTKSGKFSGKFNKLTANGERIEILEVKDEDDKPCGRFKFLFRKDVLKIELSESTIEKENETNFQVENMNRTEPSRDESQLTFELSQKQIDFIHQKINNCTLFRSVDASYFAALEDISKYLVIGLSTGGISVNR